MKRIFIIAATTVVLSALVAGIAYLIIPSHKQDSAKIQKFAQQYAGTYYGVLPCADCEGIETFLYIFPDGTFLKTDKYAGKSEDGFDSAGSWLPRKNYSVFELMVITGDIEYWQITGADTITKLDANGKKIKSSLNYSLQRQP